MGKFLDILVDKRLTSRYSDCAMGVSWFRQVVCWIQSAVEWRPNCQKTLNGNKLSFAA